MCWRQGIFRGKLNNHTHIIFRWDLKPRADLCYLEGFSSYSLLWCQVPVEGAELGWARELVVSEHGGAWGILKETLRWPNFWPVFSEQAAPRETCICLRQRKPLFDVPTHHLDVRVLRAASKVTYFPAFSPVAPLCLAGMPDTGGEEETFSPTTRTPRSAPSSWPAPTHLVSAGFSQPFPGPAPPQVCGCSRVTHG